MADVLAMVILHILAGNWAGWIVLLGLIVMLVSFATGLYIIAPVGLIILGFGLRKAIHDKQP